MTGKAKTADDLVAEALKSVERIERERQIEDAASDDIDLDAVEVLPASDLPPSATSAGDDDEEILIDDDAPRPKNDPILEAMIFAKNEAVGALEQTQKEAKSMQERLQRVSADFENYKKRQERENEQKIRFANEKLLKDLMPILDNMVRATTAGHEAVQNDADDAAATILEGTAMVLHQFEETLGRFGIKPFDSMGQPFNPNLHEAVGGREDLTVPNQTVIEEYQRGYMLRERLARPAMVVVSSGGPARQAGSGGDDGASNAES